MRPAFADQSNGGHDLAGRAIAALEGIVVDEGLLHRVQGTILCQSFHGCHSGTVQPNREDKTGRNAASIHEHSAGAALAVVTALLGTSQIQILAQRVEQRRPRCNGQRAHYVINMKRDCNL
jgi:hypothetical protein